MKLKESSLRLHIIKKIFPVNVMRHGKRLPRETVDAPPQAVFKARVDEALST